MRIALCFSGMLRTFDKCIPTIINNVIESNPEHQFDSFISTWDIHGRNPVWWEVSKDNTPIVYGDLAKYFAPLNLKRLMIERYEGSDFMAGIKHKDEVVYKDRQTQCNPYNCLPMFYKMHQSFYLMVDHARSNLINYDIIVRLRTDLLFTQPMKFTKPDENRLYFPTIENWGRNDFLINDQFGYGNPYVMNIYMTLHAHMERIYKIIGSIHPETVLGHRLLEQGIIPVREDIVYRIER